MTPYFVTVRRPRSVLGPAQPAPAHAGLIMDTEKQIYSSCSNCSHYCNAWNILHKISFNLRIYIIEYLK